MNVYNKFHDDRTNIRKGKRQTDGKTEEQVINRRPSVLKTRVQCYVKLRCLAKIAIYSRQLFQTISNLFKPKYKESVLRNFILEAVYRISNCIYYHFFCHDYHQVFTLGYIFHITYLSFTLSNRKKNS